MKKTNFAYLGASFLCLLFTSCSKSEEQVAETTQSPSLITKMIETNSNGTVITRTIIYDGNKIIEGNDDRGNKTKYTYNGDLITKIEELKNNIRRYVTTYTYENNKLKIEEGIQYKVDINDNIALYKHYRVYSYNMDGSIIETYNSTNITQNITSETKTYKMTFSSGNLKKREQIGNPATESIDTEEYEFDSKANPLSKITGLSKIYFRVGINNTTKEISSYSYPSNGQIISNSSTGTLQYTYNGSNLPTEEKRFDRNNVLYSTTQYFY